MLEVTVIQCTPSELCETLLCIKTVDIETFLNESDWTESELLLIKTQSGIQDFQLLLIQPQQSSGSGTVFNVCFTAVLVLSY